jgi:dihydropteroate synthase
MQLRCAEQLLDLSRPAVMGVLNVTPDSFSDGGRFDKLVAEGADIIDVGGESTRPGAAPVPAEEELRRVVPVIERIRSETSAIVSIDTLKPEVMQAAARAGAGLINDVRALQSAGAMEVAVASGCAVCLMHMQGEPRTMQLNPTYSDVVSEVKAFLLQRVQACRSAGFAAERIVIDPGFGFGKTAAHNLELLSRLSELTDERLPVLVGLSRKSTIAKILGDPSRDRMPASIALAVIAAMNGALIIRAHDVAATVDAMKMVSASKR